MRRLSSAHVSVGSATCPSNGDHAIQLGYKYYGYDPENYWYKTVEEKEPAPVERGTPALILSHQVEKLGLPDQTAN